ncbi:hypothetical protein ACSBR2_029137 [Camellia fascicularis]
MAIDENDRHSIVNSQFNSFLEGQFSSGGSMSELNKYLGDVEKGGKNAQFDILEWWKVNATKYTVLSLIAQDVLAMPISTVASESAFSTGGRILDPFRSSYAPKTVEVLVSTQNWHRCNILTCLRQAMEDVEEFEQQYDSCTIYNDLFYFLSISFILYYSKFIIITSHVFVVLCFMCSCFGIKFMFKSKSGK